jgi:hypothetical protein
MLKTTLRLSLCAALLLPGVPAFAQDELEEAAAKTSPLAMCVAQEIEASQAESAGEDALKDTPSLRSGA